MLNLITSTVRTFVPYAMGLVVSWLVAHDLITAAVADQLTGWSTPLAGAVVLAVTTTWYVLVRLVELHLPKLLARLLPAEYAAAVARWVVVVLVGSPKQPDYTATARA